MNCPACGLEVHGLRDDCASCGIIFSKFGKHSVAPPPRVAGKSEGLRTDREGPQSRTIAAGFGEDGPVEEGKDRAEAQSRGGAAGLGEDGRVAGGSAAGRVAPAGRALSLHRQKLLFDLAARGLRSGLGIPEICHGLSAAPGPLADVAVRVAGAVEAGEPFSEALQSQARGINQLVLNLVRIGEESGRLEEACTSAATHVGELLSLRRALLSPLVYPMVMLLLSFFMLPVPDLVLRGAGVYFARVAASFGWALLVFAPLIGLVVWASRSRALLEGILTAPVGRDVHRYLVTENLYAVLRTGYPIPRGIELLSQGYQSGTWRQRFAEASARLTAGESFADIVAALKLYDPEALMTIRAGEQSGSLDEVFADLCKRYREAATRRLALAARVITAVLGLAILAALAFRILGAFQGVLGGNEELLREIERASPIKRL